MRSDAPSDPPKLGVLVVGQVPPPYGGQTIMTKVLLEGRYDDAELIHVDSAFSTSLSDMGRTSMTKLVRLARVLVRALWVRARRHPSVLYYHPAGASKSAILRDLALLSVLRPLFSRVVFHLHARGLTEACGTLPRPLRTLARRVYANPDVLLGPSTVIVDEAVELGASYTRVIPNGTRGGTPRQHRPAGPTMQILFLNLISEAKGASWLLDAFAELRGSGVDAQLTLVGEFESAAYRDEFLAQCRKLDLHELVRLPGIAVGEDKWRAMAAADIFCLPTTWPQESFGLALIEAASCGLPIVAADVAGVRDVLEPGVSVLLADPHDRPSLARHLHHLCDDPAARERLGTAAREAFEHHYTVDRYWAELGEVFAMMREARRALA
jgi:glycosyltransferase involved in cell wall biosynthesis